MIGAPSTVSRDRADSEGNAWFRAAGPLTPKPFGTSLSVTDPYSTVLAVIPVFDDWEALGVLLGKLDQVAEAQSFSLKVLLVDDGSATPLPEKLRSTPCLAIREGKGSLAAAQPGPSAGHLCRASLR